MITKYNLNQKELIEEFVNAGIGAEIAKKEMANTIKTIFVVPDRARSGDICARKKKKMVHNVQITPAVKRPARCIVPAGVFQNS